MQKRSNSSANALELHLFALSHWYIPELRISNIQLATSTGTF